MGRRWHGTRWAVVVLLTSCTGATRLTYRQLDQPRALPARPPEQRLSAEQVRDDLALLRYALERGYAGRPFVPRHAWDQMLDGFDAADSRPQTVSELCDRIGDAFWSIPDAHLVARRATPSNPVFTNCGVLRLKHARRPTVGRAPAEPIDRPWQRTTETLRGRSLGVLRIRSFPDHADPVWGDFAGATRELLASDAVIIDLRGNGGGDDSRGYELAQRLVDSKVWGGSGLTVHRRETPESLTLVKNTLDDIARQPDGTRAAYMREAYERIEARRDEALRGRQAEFHVSHVPPPEVHSGPNAFAGPVAIVVDEACASSCESSLFVLRQHPRALVFGARTAGYIQFGDIGSLVLPNSGVRVGIASKFNEFGAGRFYEKVGFQPDVYVSPGNDALRAALEWARDQL